MKLSQPTQALFDLSRSDTGKTQWKASLVEIFQYEQQPLFGPGKREQLRDPTVLVATCAPEMVPFGFHLVGEDLPFVGQV